MDGFLGGAAAQNTDGMDWRQMRAIIVSQAIRNAFENFHGVFDEEHKGFLTDDQMKRLNICVRKTVYEALNNIELVESFSKATQKGWEVKPDEKKAYDYFTFQAATYHPDYMEAPGTDELDKAFNKQVLKYEGIKR